MRPAALMCALSDLDSARRRSVPVLVTLAVVGCGSSIGEAAPDLGAVAPDACALEVAETRGGGLYDAVDVTDQQTAPDPGEKDAADGSGGTGGKGRGDVGDATEMPGPGDVFAARDIPDAPDIAETSDVPEAPDVLAVRCRRG